jgi:hypothetical protein
LCVRPATASTAAPQRRHDIGRDGVRGDGGGVGRLRRRSCGVDPVPSLRLEVAPRARARARVPLPRHPRRVGKTQRGAAARPGTERSLWSLPGVHAIRELWRPARRRVSIRPSRLRVRGFWRSGCLRSPPIVCRTGRAWRGWPRSSIRHPAGERDVVWVEERLQCPARRERGRVAPGYVGWCRRCSKRLRLPTVVHYRPVLCPS